MWNFSQSECNDDLSNCSFVKTILMLTVVIYHAMLFWGGVGWFTGTPVYNSDILREFALCLNYFHVQAFTLVAAYLYCYLRYECGKYAEFVPFCRKKLQRLIVPYIFVSAFWVVPFSVYFFDLSMKDVFIKYVLATSPSQLWFVWMLFDVFLLAWIVSDKLYASNKFAVCITLFLLLMGIIGGKLLPNVFCIWTACRYFIYFVIGFKIRQYGMGTVQRISPILWILLYVLLYVLMIYAGDYGGIVGKVFKTLLSIVVSATGAVMAFVVLMELAGKVAWQNNKYFMAFSKKTMPIYLLHQQLIYVSISLFNGAVNQYFNAAINIAVALLGSYSLIFVLYKSRNVRKLMGENK